MTAKSLSIKIILPLLIIALAAVVFTGCSVATPEVTINGHTATWREISDAYAYEVNVNDTTFQTSDTSVNLIEYIQGNGSATVRVRALSNSFFSSSSGYSEEITVSTSAPRLNAPQNFNITVDENVYTLSWDSVENADHYCISLSLNGSNPQYLHTDSTTFKISGQLEAGGEYSVAVFAYADNINEFAPSLYSNSDSLVYRSMLEYPDNVEATITSNNGVYLTWDTVKGASGYNVSVLNGDTYSTNTTSITLDLDLNSGDMAVLSVQAVSNDETYRLNSAFSDSVAIYTNAPQSSYANKKYNLGTTEFDLVADSYSELETIIHHGLYYRIENIGYFANYTGYSTSDFERALQSYVEIKYISYNRIPSRNSYGMYQLTISNYYHTAHPTSIATGNNTVEQDTDVVPTSYTDTPRADDFDDFKINNRTTTMMVYNSDQLYYAIENGARPTFPNSSAPAYIAYEAAKDVLREIVDDSMTDYEKTLAIFDWLCYTVKYDYNLVDLTATITDQTIYDYRGFYIEGVLFDGGQAVCDGIAKTFALLCGLEGIDCYKVTGTSGDAGHAWNKVFLDMNGDGTGEWYALDATWNDLTEVAGNTYTETLSHQFFLTTDAYLTLNQHTETSPLTHTANTPFDYYSYTTYDGTHSLYITNVNELMSLINYVNNNPEITSFEFKTILPYTTVSKGLSTALDSNYSPLTDYTIYIIKLV